MPPAAPSADRSKPAAPKPDEGAPAVQLGAPDIAVTGPTSPQGVPRKESDAEREAREVRERFAHVVAEMQKGPHGMKLWGAGLVVAHLIAEKGRDAVAAMKLSELDEWARLFRLRYPGAWGAAAVGNAVGFVKHLRLSGLRCGEGDDKPEQVVFEYQGLSSKLAPVG